MDLRPSLREYVAACFTGIWVETHEQDDASTEIARLCHEEDWRFAAWNIDQGLRVAGGETVDAGSDPLTAIRSLNSLATPDGTAILVLNNFHRFLGSAEIVEALARQIATGKLNRTFVVILSPIVQIPTELEKLFVVLEHELPGREPLEEIARGIATEEGEMPDEAELQRVLDASAGLSRFEAEGAYSLSLIRHGTIRPEAVWSIKAGTLKKNGLLSLHRGEESFDGLGGLDALKSFCRRAMRNQCRSDPLRRPRGVLLLSPPGCGKSQFAKSLGNETGRPTLILDVGALMGSLVGETERNVRSALRIIDAMSPCVCLIDEVEKALSGVNGSGDSGVSARLFGTILSWLNDRTSDSFVICTCNDISKMPPEFGRSERFDGIWFLDLPGEEQRRAIWDIYVNLFQLDSKQPLPDDSDWTGAEVRACCRLSALLDVPLVQAAQNVVPVARTANESVDRLRTWATQRCLDAQGGGIYRCDASHGNHKK